MSFIWINDTAYININEISSIQYFFNHKQNDRSLIVKIDSSFYDVRVDYRNDHVSIYEVYSGNPESGRKHYFLSSYSTDSSDRTFSYKIDERLSYEDQELINNILIEYNNDRYITIDELSVNIIVTIYLSSNSPIEYEYKTFNQQYDYASETYTETIPSNNELTTIAKEYVESIVSGKSNNGMIL